MKKGNRAKEGKKGIVILIVVLAILIVGAGILLALKLMKDKKENYIGNQEQEPEVVVLNTPKVKIVDTESTTRPYAVMINNHHSAWPQCGLSDAYIVYEFIAEGGITRMMAIFKDKYPEKVGSVRSARHYFIDYAEENDAIFIHWGGSEQAYSRIYSGIDDLDGMALEGSVFFRDKSLNRSSEHTGFVDLTKAKEYIEKNNYRTKTNKDLLLNYSVDEIGLKEKEDAEVANNIVLKYSDYHTTSYIYDEENKVYKRYMGGKEHVDLETGEHYTAKNIIVYKVRNFSIDDYGRQDLENITKGEGYYITDGYAVPIDWEKKSHSGQTVYKYKNGGEIDVNDGNTYIQLVPTNGNINITE